MGLREVLVVVCGFAADFCVWVYCILVSICIDVSGLSVCLACGYFRLFLVSTT